MAHRQQHPLSLLPCSSADPTCRALGGSADLLTTFTDFAATKKEAIEQKVLGNPWLQGTIIAGAFITLMGVVWATLWMKRKLF
jgi:hypothetical protein